jgi:hypothetical protein
MKYLLLILSLVALIGTATAKTPQLKDNGKGKECWSTSNGCCCKK